MAGFRDYRFSAWSRRRRVDVLGNGGGATSPKRRCDGVRRVRRNGAQCKSDRDEPIGGLTLTPGVYNFTSSAFLTGTLTLDSLGDPNALFVFQIGSTLITASDASVLSINGTNGCNIYWQVGSSATLGTGTDFEGSILALTSITLNTNADIMNGRALALNGAVTLDSNTITPGCIPAPGAGLLLACSAFVCGRSARRRTA